MGERERRGDSRSRAEFFRRREPDDRTNESKNTLVKFTFSRTYRSPPRPPTRLRGPRTRRTPLRPGSPAPRGPEGARRRAREKRALEKEFGFFRRCFMVELFSFLFFTFFTSRSTTKRIAQTKPRFLSAFLSLFPAFRPLERRDRVSVVLSARLRSKTAETLRSRSSIEAERWPNHTTPAALDDEGSSPRSTTTSPSSPSTTARKPSTTSRRSCSCRSLSRSTTCTG
jgi:hypothetical protein